MGSSGLNLNSTNKMVKRFRTSETWCPTLLFFNDYLERKQL